MIFKVLYQADKTRIPRRETTQALYMKCDTEMQARIQLEKYTNYNIEYVEPLEGNHLKYEESEPDFKITKFN